MEKSIYSPDYATVIERLRIAREEKGLTQTDVADRLGRKQSFVSKVERGERRIDVIELRAFCGAIGIDFTTFIRKLDAALRE